MNRQTLVLIATAFLCTIITPLGYAKSDRYFADKSNSLKGKFRKLCGKNGYSCNQYEGNSKLIKKQAYYPRPTQRRKLKHQRLDRVKDQFLSFPPVRIKDEALSNLERRTNIVKQAK